MPPFGDVTNRLVTAAVSEARQRRVVLATSGQEAVGELAGRASQSLEDLNLLDDDAAIERAEGSLRRLVQTLPSSPEVERRAAGGAAAIPVDEATVRQAYAGLCPGLWPLC